MRRRTCRQLRAEHDTEQIEWADRPPGGLLGVPVADGALERTTVTAVGLKAAV
jgi:hypothetical protein